MKRKSVAPSPQPKLGDGKHVNRIQNTKLSTYMKNINSTNFQIYMVSYRLYRNIQTMQLKKEKTNRHLDSGTAADTISVKKETKACHE